MGWESVRTKLLSAKMGAYHFKELYACFDANHPNGHPAVQLPPEEKGFNSFHKGSVFKVTHPNDIKFVELLMAQTVFDK